MIRGERDRSFGIAKEVFQHLGGVAIVLAPLVTCLLAGCLRASLWLDEIHYWYLERSRGFRALESRRPGSRIAPFFLNFFYCDIQRAVHWVVRRFGLTLESDPELYLRMFSLAAFVAMALGTYALTYRQSRSWSWSVTASLALSASPLLLFYAFEARVTAFATLCVVLYLALLCAALCRPERPSLRLLGAIFGIFLGHLHVWIVCLFAGLVLAAIARFLFARRKEELWTIAAFALPGSITAVAESAFITLTYPPGFGFPLYVPRAFAVLRERTLAGAFSTWMTPPPPLLHPFSRGPSVPLLVLAVAVMLVLANLRRLPILVVPLAAVLALWLSLEIGSHIGFLVSPRYQVPLFGALFFSLSLATSRPVRLWIGLLAAVELVLLPTAISDIGSKGNGKDIAAIIEKEAPRERTAIVIQHGLRLGYPDPLHNFVLHFYLDELHPERAPIRIFELPALRDITGREGLDEYFGGGPALRKSYAGVRSSEWESWLRECPYDRLWFVFPVPVIGIEKAQAEAFAASLARRGFLRDRTKNHLFAGYPATSLWLLVRRAI